MDPQEVIRQVLEALGQSSLRTVQGLIGSRTLRSALRLIVEEGQSRARLFIPHYWAVYYHDGRGAFGPVSATKLVFFDDPDDDPRLAGGYPERASQIRRLTKSQYEFGLEMNRQRRANGGRPFMYVVNRVGPQAARPFFDQLAAGASARDGRFAAQVFDAHVQRFLDEDPALRPERGTASFDLG